MVLEAFRYVQKWDYVCTVFSYVYITGAKLGYIALKIKHMKNPILALIRAFLIVHLAFVGVMVLIDVSPAQLLQYVNNLTDVDFLLTVGVLALGELTLICLLITNYFSNDGRTN